MSEPGWVMVTQARLQLVRYYAGKFKRMAIEVLLDDERFKRMSKEQRRALAARHEASAAEARAFADEIECTLIPKAQ